MKPHPVKGKVIIASASFSALVAIQIMASKTLRAGKIPFSLFKCWTAMMIFMPVAAKGASTLHIEGTASFIQYKRDGSVASTFDGRFTLATDLSKWKVQYFSDTDKTEQETTFDGNLTYTLSKNFPVANFQPGMRGPLAEEVIAADGQHYLSADIAEVGSSQEPSSLFVSARVAWLNLVACGLISDPPPRLVPPWLSAASSEASAYTSRLDESSLDRECCAQIEFVTSRKLRAASQKGAGAQTSLIDVPKEAFVEARFQVLSQTNIQSRCIPLKAELVRFWFPNIQDKTGNSVRSVIRTTVSRHYFSSEPVSLPLLSKKTYVTDSRFKSSEEPDFLVNYALTNNKWVEEGDPRLEAWVEQSRTNYLRMQEHLKELRPKSASSQ